MRELIAKIGAGPFGSGAQADLQRVAFISTFALIAKLICSDGTMDKKELLLVDQLMSQSMKLDDARRKYATAIFNETKRSNLSVKNLVLAYKDALEDKPKMYEWLLDILVRLSLVDEILLPEEDVFLIEVSTLLGFDQAKLNEIKARYVTFSRDDSAYKLLGLSISKDTKPNFEAVQNAYDLSMRKYDVERLISEGFGEDLIELASKKQAELTSAYLKIKKL